MEFLYNFNALPFYSEAEISMRHYITQFVSTRMKEILIKQNAAWKFFQIEAPCLMPKELVNQNYTDEDMFIQKPFNDRELVLKPETTPSSYIYMEHLLHQQLVMPPFVVWQMSKSFRKEQDQPTKHCRYKEFYQQEFQCAYSEDSKNNYQESCIEEIAKMFLDLIALPTRIVKSDRLPDYSLKTLDVEVFNEDKWMEVCSVSLRKDFTPLFKNKKMLVLEVATSPDRITYNIQQREKVFKSLVVVNEVK